MIEMERPIVFCHEIYILLSNIVLPGGLEAWWRRNRLCLMDWQNRGWTPIEITAFLRRVFALLKRNSNIEIFFYLYLSRVTYIFHEMYTSGMSFKKRECVVISLVSCKTLASLRCASNAACSISLQGLPSRSTSTYYPSSWTRVITSHPVIRQKPVR